MTHKAMKTLREWYNKKYLSDTYCKAFGEEKTALTHIMECFLVLDRYKIILEKDYNYNLDIPDYVSRRYGQYKYMQLLELEENVIIEDVIRYVVDQRAKFTSTYDALNSAEVLDDTIKQRHRQMYERLDELVTMPEHRNIVAKALEYFQIIDRNGKSVITHRQRGKLAGFIDALKECRIIPAYADAKLHESFCTMLSIENTRLRRDSNQYEDMKAEVVSYLKRITAKNK